LLFYPNRSKAEQTYLFSGEEEKHMKQATAIWGMLGIALVVALGVLAATGNLGKLGLASVTTEEGAAVVQPTGGGVVDCNNAPTLSVAVRNAKQTGTAIITDKLYAVNSVYFGETAPTFKYGDKVQVLANKTSYIDVLAPVVTLTCGANSIAIDMFDYAAPAVEMKEDNTVLTDGVAGINASTIVAGGSNTLEVCITGTDKISTGDLVYVLEVGTNSKVSDINVYDGNGNLEKTDVPDFYVDTLTSPFKKAFKIPAIVGAQEKCFSITIAAKSAQTVEGVMYTTFYVAEPTVDVDGKFLPSVIENADGTATYEATFDYDISMDS
jgi:hypothetical protein